MTANKKVSGENVLFPKSFIKSLKSIFRKEEKQSNPRKGFEHKFPANFFQTYMVSSPGKPVWTQRDYQRFSDEAYTKNVVAYRCISLIAQAASCIPWLLYTSGEERHEITEHPVLKLLRQPNPNSSGVEFMESFYSYKMISGNAYLQAAKDMTGEVKELYLLRPDRMSIVAGKNYLPYSYRYSVGNSYKEFPVNRITGKSDILHIKSFHPLNDWQGLSPIEAAAYSIDQHNQAGEWNQALLQNGARPSGALVVKPNAAGTGGSLDEETYKRLKQQIDDQFTGAMNAGRPLLLEGGLEWREMSLSPKDMDFLHTKHSAARDIALAFGVPPQLLGIPGDNTYSNLVEARIALWEQTILPLVDNLVSGLNNWLIPMMGGGMVLEYDKDEIGAIVERREQIYSRLEGINFITINEKRQIAGFSPIPTGDKII